ncbi:MAG TPA: hypothetical protein VEB20_09035 [Azospirillaceae bacterium]|nr:hypothetical protein [Azospirillaceae bacterium]
MEPTPIIEEEARRVAALDGLVEAGMDLARLGGRLAELLPDEPARERAALLLRDLRDLVERAADAAEQDLQRLRAEKGIHPDD